jgi:antitoxin VapB
MSRLYIKNEETCRLVRELAELKGETITEAVRVAVQHALEEEKQRTKKESRMDWLKRITAETAPLMNDGRTSKEVMDELYDDETGLPK